MPGYISNQVIVHLHWLCFMTIGFPPRANAVSCNINESKKNLLNRFFLAPCYILPLGSIQTDTVTVNPSLNTHSAWHIILVITLPKITVE